MDLFSPLAPFTEGSLSLSPLGQWRVPLPVPLSLTIGQGVSELVLGHCSGGPFQDTVRHSDPGSYRSNILPLPATSGEGDLGPSLRSICRSQGSCQKVDVCFCSLFSPPPPPQLDLVCGRQRKPRLLISLLGFGGLVPVSVFFS